VPVATNIVLAARAQSLLQQQVVCCNSSVPAATARCLLQHHGACCNSTVPAATARCQCNITVPAATARCLLSTVSLQHHGACCNSTVPECNSTLTAAIGVFCNIGIPAASACCTGIAYFLPILQFCLLQQHVGVACCNNMMPLLLREHIACCNIKSPAATAW
jgi:hypothetical protein